MAMTLHPGIVRTSLFRYLTSGFSLKSILTIGLVLPLYPITKSPHQGAQTQIHCSRLVVTTLVRLDFIRLEKDGWERAIATAIIFIVLFVPKPLRFVRGHCDCYTLEQHCMHDGGDGYLACTQVERWWWWNDAAAC